MFMNEIGNVPFSKGNQRVRDQILHILSEDFPLSPKELFSRVSRKGQDVTYQAVHKVVTQLKEEGVVVQNGKGVQLSHNWIQQVKDYAMTVDTIYTNGKQHKLPAKLGERHVIEFEDISSCVIYMAQMYRDFRLTNGKRVSCYGIFNHFLWPLRFNFMDFELLRQMVASNPEAIAISAQDTPFDRWIGKHYQLGGMKVAKTGVIDVPPEEDIMAHGEYIVKIRFSPEAKQFMSKIYNKISNLGDLFKYYFSDIAKEKNQSVTMIIEHNPLMARMLKNQIMSYLKKEEVK